MIRSIFNDGDLLSIQEIQIIEQKGFIVDLSRDFTTTPSPEMLKSNEKKFKLNYVGFTINQNGDILNVFPKKYQWSSQIDDDRKIIFATLIKHIQKNPSMYLGEEFENKIGTNFPFAAFFSIYEYFERFGLHFKEQNKCKPYRAGKANWKETIRLSEKYIIDCELIMFPVYYDEKFRTETFISQCMTYAINYTIDKFNFFINKQKVNKPIPEFDFLKNKEPILEKLRTIKNYTFNNIHIKLISDLIEFFSLLNFNGRYYFKHYSYELVWEKMVEYYLRYHFIRFENKQMILSETRLPVQREFRKETYKPNLANRINYIQPDHYLEDGNNQVIIDAKYYEPSDMNYKQISYLFFLRNRRENVSTPPKFSNTYSALIIPYNGRNSKLHFEMDPIYNKEFEDAFISEERININQVINFWIKP